MPGISEDDDRTTTGKALAVGAGRRITITDSVLYQQVEAETILLHRTTGHFYGLDEIGSRVWQLLQEHGGVEPVVAALVEEYEVDETTLRADVERLLGELSGVGLIQLGPPIGA